MARHSRNQKQNLNTDNADLELINADQNHPHKPKRRKKVKKFFRREKDLEIVIHRGIAATKTFETRRNRGSRGKPKPLTTKEQEVEDEGHEGKVRKIFAKSFAAWHESDCRRPLTDAETAPPCIVKISRSY
jgi:hypothetical protein